MNKVILILDGYSVAKNEFDKYVKRLGYWTWNVNHRNLLGEIVGMLRGSKERDQLYYDTMEAVKELAEGMFNFEESYTNEKIENFKGHEKANLLLIHNCSEQLSERLKSDHGVITVYLGKETCPDGYDYEILFDDTFEENVKNLLDVLSK